MKQFANSTTRVVAGHLPAHPDGIAFSHGFRARATASLRRSAAIARAHTSEMLPRIADRVVALFLLLMLLPLLMIRGLAGLFLCGKIFQYTSATGRNGRQVSRLFFSRGGAGRGLASLINVLFGELALVGPTERSLPGLPPGFRAELLRLRPGLISPADARERMGISHDGEGQVLREFVRNESVRGNVGVLARSLFSRAAYGAQGFAAPSQLSFFGVGIWNVTMDAAVDWILARSGEVGRVFVPFVNPHCLNLACTDSEYHSVLQQADRVLPDGSGIRIGCRMKRQRLIGNVNGTDLFPRLCERLSRSGKSLFLLGAAEGVAATVADNMQMRFPELKIAGVHDGFFTPEQTPEVIREINNSGAHVLLVAMGVPLQEKWIAQHLHALDVPVCMGVGGLFDFYSGRIPRAPMWLRELGVEWIWRLMQEPGRMWRRYLIGNPLFVLRVLREHRSEQKRPLSSLPDVSPLAHWFVLLRARARRDQWLRTIRTDHTLRRMLDSLGAGGLLLALAPVLMLVAVAIRLESPGPVLFSQPRVGRHGRVFRFWKFRSMHVDAEARIVKLREQNEIQGGVLFKMRKDPRVTGVGRFIRRASIDELPQLWNVLRGDMSLVGPRPALPGEVAQYSLADRARLEAIPGITCIWQVSGRSEIPFAQQVEMDCEYIRRSSMRTNIELLLKTIPAVVSCRGAY